MFSLEEFNPDENERRELIMAFENLWDTQKKQGRTKKLTFYLYVSLSLSLSISYEKEK